MQYHYARREIIRRALNLWLLFSSTTKRRRKLVLDERAENVVREPRALPRQVSPVMQNAANGQD